MSDNDRVASRLTMRWSSTRFCGRVPGRKFGPLVQANGSAKREIDRLLDDRSA